MSVGPAGPSLTEPSRRRHPSSRAAGVALAALGAATLVAATSWWWDVTGVVPAVQPLYPLVPVAAVALVAVSALARRRVAAAIAAAALVLSGVAIVPVLAAPLRAPAGPDEGRRLTVLAQNLEYGNADSARLVTEAVDREVDVLVLTEADAGYLDRLARTPLRQRLPYDSGPVRPGGAPGTAVWSRYPLRVLDGDLGHRRGEHFQQPIVSLDVEGRQVRVHAVHPLSPTSRSRLPLWRSGLADLAAWQRGQPGEVPIVLAGDFNAGWPHPAFREVADGMTDAFAATGRPWAATWPIDRRLPAFAQIDHILVRGAGVEDAGTVWLPDTDHAGVWARITLPPPSRTMSDEGRSAA